MSVPQSPATPTVLNGHELLTPSPPEPEDIYPSPLSLPAPIVLWPQQSVDGGSSQSHNTASSHSYQTASSSSEVNSSEEDVIFIREVIIVKD